MKKLILLSLLIYTCIAANFSSFNNASLSKTSNYNSMKSYVGSFTNTNNLHSSLLDVGSSVQTTSVLNTINPSSKLSSNTNLHSTSSEKSLSSTHASSERANETVNETANKTSFVSSNLHSSSNYSLRSIKPTDSVNTRLVSSTNSEPVLNSQSTLYTENKKSTTYTNHTKNSTNTSKTNKSNTISTYINPNKNDSTVYFTTGANTSIKTQNPTTILPTSYISNRTHTSSKHMFPWLRINYKPTCDNGHAEVVQKMKYGWKNNQNTGFGGVAADMISDIKNKLTSGIASNDFTSSTRRGGIKCGMWAGAMVSNSDTMNALTEKMRNNLRNEDLPTGKYFEYVSDDGNPMKTFGVYCQVNSNENDVNKAIKGWSRGQSASTYVNGISGTADFGSQSICYLSYASRKTGNLANDDTREKCDSTDIKAGVNAADACRVPGDSLQLYNKDVDFTSLSPGDLVCCSIGDGKDIDPARSYKCDNGNTKLVKSITYGWKNTNTNYQDGKTAADMVTDIMNFYKSTRRSFTAFSTRGGLKCGAWAGAMFSITDSADSLEKAIRTNLQNEGIPNGKYFEYISDDGNPMKYFGLYCSNNDNSNLVSTAVKGWSEGKRVTDVINGISGTSSIEHKPMCFTSYNGRRQGNSAGDSNLGICNHNSIEQGKSASDACHGLSGDVLSYYNNGLDFSSLSPGDLVCCSIGDGRDIDPARSYKCDNGNTKLVKSVTYGWKDTNTNYQDGKTAADMVTDIMNFYKSTRRSFTAFSTRGGLKCGAWAGSMFSITDSANSLEKAIRTNLQNEGIPNGKYFEYISDDGNPMKYFGLYCSNNDNSNLASTAVKGWSEGKRVTDVINGISGTSNIQRTPMCFTQYNSRRQGNSAADPNLGTCNYNRIQNGKTASDACHGLSGDVLSSYNSADINKVQPDQPVCCSIGDMPDFRPKKNSDGSCFSHTFKKGDTCSAVLAKYYPLSEDDLMKYNKQTFNWLGCKNGHPWENDVICLSDGTPPRPIANPLAECGPQAPGDKYMSECPLNACCSQYGFCGLTSEFCEFKESLTNAPGTTGCMSGCDSPNFSGPSSTWVNIGYFDGSKKQSVLKYGNDYDVIHLAFANVSPDHNKIDPSNIQNSYNEFKNVKAKKVLSIGGWDFSTDPSTYHILREAIENDYDHFANVIVSFMQQPENSFLDGFDIDWEYPGAPDIPGIPPDSKDAGNKLLELVKAVRLRMDRSKSLSLAIPSSYWYLKNFPLKEISEYADYLVFMTYDLHGQWDYGEKFSGGPYTSCHTNMQETEDSLRMIVKAGIPESKIRVGLANYARTYRLESPCDGEKCKFTGPESGAEKGKDTNVAGILSQNEIEYIKKNRANSINKLYDNSTSMCTYMRYDDVQWAAWTTDNKKRQEIYKSLGFGGSSLWVANYVNGNTDSNDTDNGNDDDYDEDNDDVDASDIVLSSLNNKNCWDKYKNIDNESQYNQTDSECIIEGTIAYLTNAALKAVSSLSEILNDDDEHKKYLDDYKGYSSYFAHNMSFAYQEWSYSNIENTDWFSCLDNNGNEVSCADALKHDYSPPCHKNCCPNIGCFKRKDGVTIKDEETTNGKCKDDSKMESCCVVKHDNNKIPVNLKRDTDYIPLVSSLINSYTDNGDDITSIIDGNTQKLLREGYYGFGSLNETYSEPLINDPLYFNEHGFKAPISIQVPDTGHLAGWRVKKQAALDSFSDYVGYKIGANGMYTQPFYRFQQHQKNDNEQICWKDQHNNVTVRCYDLPQDQLYNRNPLQNLDNELLQNVTNLVKNARSAMDNNEDYYVDILKSINVPLSSIIDLKTSVDIIRSIGHNYGSRCELLRVMEILGPILQVLGFLTMFLGPVTGIIANLALTLVNIGVNPDKDVASIVEQLVGAAAGAFSIARAGRGRFRGHASSYRKIDKIEQRTLSLIKNKVDKNTCII